jgi:hypothetical protein
MAELVFCLTDRQFGLVLPCRPVSFDPGSPVGYLDALGREQLLVYQL